MIKGLTDVQQRLLEELIGKYMAIETNMKKNGLNLTQDTLTTISQAPKVAEFAESQGLQLPKSTYDILRYGPVVQKEIFPSLDKMTQYSKVKVRVRKGVQYNQILTWNDRTIESILKKSGKPKVKSQDDKKCFKEFLTKFNNFEKFNEDKDLFETYERLFLAKDSPFTQHFIKGQNILDDYKEKNDKLEQREKERASEKKQFDSLVSERDQFDTKISDLTNKFYTENTAGRSIRAKREQIESTQKSDPLASYLKLLGDIIEIFDSYASKQKINLSFDEQNVLRELKESLLTPDKNIDLHFADLLSLIIRHADAAYGKKHWYMKLLQELGSANKLDSYLQSGPGFSAWVEVREFSKDVYEMEQTEDFKKFQEQVNELEAEKNKILENLNRTQERLRRFTQDTEELSEQLTGLKANLQQWATDAKELS